MQINLTIPKAFRGLFKPARYKVYYGGRGGAKSYAIADYLIICAMQEQMRILCAREFQVSIADSVHAMLAARIVELGFGENFDIGQKTIVCTTTGSEFIFKGLKHNVTEVKGLFKIKKAWLEEAQILSDQSWEILIPTVRDPDSEIIVSFNPRYPTDPTYARMILDPSDGAIVKKVSWRDNPFFPDVLDRERRDLERKDPEAHAHVWEGEFDTRYFGGVYSKQVAKLKEQGRMRKALYDPDVPVNTAWDLGYDDATAIWFWQKVGTEIRLVDYYENNGQDIEHYCEYLKSKPYAYGKHYVPHDASNKLLAAGGRSIVQQAFALGVRMHVVPATSQQNGIEALRKTLEVTYIDEDRCRDGINCLMQYQFEYDTDKQTFKSAPRHDWSSHGSDACEIIGQVWRNDIQEKEVKKPKFLHEATANDLFWPEKSYKRPERI